MAKKLSKIEIKALLDIICLNKSTVCYAADDENEERLVEKTTWIIDSTKLPVDVEIEVKEPDKQ